MFNEREEMLKTAAGGICRTMLNFDPHSIRPQKTTDISLIVKLGLEVVGLRSELSLKNRFIGSDAVTRECRNYEETKDWRFTRSFQEAFSAMN